MHATAQDIPAVSLEETPPLAAFQGLWGLTILGLFLVNINVFGTVYAAQANPYVFGSCPPRDLWTWAVTYILLSDKVTLLFPLLWGATALMWTWPKKHASLAPGDIHFRRCMWLMVIGGLNGYFFFAFDWLYFYAIFAFLLFLLRHASAKRLLVLALLFISLTGGYRIYKESQWKQMAQWVAQVEEEAKQGITLTEEQEAAKQMFYQKRASYFPRKWSLWSEIKEWRSDFSILQPMRYRWVFSNQTKPYYSLASIEVWGIMLLGMALLRNGVLTGEKSKRFYQGLLFGGYLLGLPLFAFIVWRKIHLGFDFQPSPLIASLTEVGKWVVTLGHIGLAMLIYKGTSFKWLKNTLSDTGKMALSHYILQGIIASTLFYGYGFGLFGALGYFDLAMIALILLATQFLLSPLWLKHFYMGPVEYLWEALTEGRWLPFKRPV